MKNTFLLAALLLNAGFGLAQNLADPMSAARGYFTLDLHAGYGYVGSWDDVDEARSLEIANDYVIRRRDPWGGYSLGAALRRRSRSGRWRVGVAYFHYTLPTKVTRTYPIRGTDVPLLVFDEFAQRDAGNAFLLTLGARLLRRRRFALAFDIAGGPVWLAIDDIETDASGRRRVLLRTLRTSNAKFNELHTQAMLRATYDLNPYYRLASGFRYNWEASTRSHPLAEVFVGIELNLVRGGVPMGGLLPRRRD